METPSDSKPAEAKSKAPTEERLSEIITSVQPMFTQYLQSSERSSRWTSLLGVAFLLTYCIVVVFLVHEGKSELVSELTKVLGAGVAGYFAGAAKKG